MHPPRKIDDPVLAPPPPPRVQVAPVPSSPAPPPMIEPPRPKNPVLDALKEKPRVKMFLDAIDDKEHHRRATKATAPIYELTESLRYMKVSAADVRAVLETGELPDGRLDAIAKEAIERGSWPAENTLSYLTGLRRAAIAGELELLEEKKATLPEGSAERAELEKAIGELKNADRALASNLRAVHAAASAARVRIIQGMLARAEHLPPKEAEVLRERAERMAREEAKYRKGMRGYDASETLRLEAQAKIDLGSEQASQMKRGERPLSDDPPAKLTEAQGVLEDARAHDPHAATDQTQLALEGRRTGAIAGFHKVHLDRSKYFDAATPRTPAMIKRREAYVKARNEQGAIAKKRVEVYGDPAKLSGDDTERAAAAQREAREVDDELRTAPAAAMAARKRAAGTEGQIKKLESERPGLLEQQKAAGEAATRSEKDAEDAGRAADPIAGTKLRTDKEVERDDAAASGTRVIASDARSEKARADERVNANERETAELKTKLPEEKAQADRDRQDAEVVSTAIGAKTVDEAYDKLGASAHAGALQEEKLLSEVERKKGPKSLYVAHARVDLALHHRRAVEVEQQARDGGMSHDDAEKRLAHADTLIEQAGRTQKAMPPGEDRKFLGARMVGAHAELAESWSEHDLAKGAEHIREAEKTIERDLHGTPYLPEATGTVGLAATHSLTRNEASFDRVKYSPDAADDLLVAANRALGSKHCPANEQTAEAKKLVEEARAAPDTGREVAAASERQLQYGMNLAYAQAGQLERAEVKLAQATIPDMAKPGPVPRALGSNPMERMAERAEDATDVRLTHAARDTKRIAIAARAVGRIAGSADRERPLKTLHALRIRSNPENREKNPASWEAAGRHLDERSGGADWRPYTAAVGRRELPAGQLFGASVLCWRPGLEVAGKTKLGARTQGMEQLLSAQSASLNATSKNATAKILVHGTLEAIAWAMVPGIGQAKAAQKSVSVVRTVRTVIAAGAATAAVNYTAGRVAGPNSAFARDAGALGNKIPAARAAKMSGVSKAGTLALAGGQTAATQVAAPYVAEKIGAQSELGRAGVAIGMNAILAGGVAGASKLGRPRAGGRASGNAGERASGNAGERAGGDAGGRVGDANVRQARAAGDEARVPLPPAGPPKTAKELWRGMSSSDRYRWLLQHYPKAKELRLFTPAELERTFGAGPYNKSLARLASKPGFAAFAIQDPAGARRLYAASQNFGVAALFRPEQKGGAPLSFAEAARRADAWAPSITPVSIPAHGGPMHFREVAQKPGVPKPSVPLALISTDDHSGAFESVGIIPRKGRRGISARSGEPLENLPIKKKQLFRSGKKSERLDSLDDVAVFAAHGSPQGFGRLDTRTAARAMADRVVSFEQRGGKRINYVALVACHQGDGQSFGSYQTNAKVFQRELNARLAEHGRAPITVLAQEKPGVLVAAPEHYQNKDRSRAGFIPAGDQKGAAKERYAAAGAGAVLVIGGAAAFYAAVRDDEQKKTRVR